MNHVICVQLNLYFRKIENILFRYILLIYMPKKNKKYANKRSRNINTQILQYANSDKKQVYAKIVKSTGGSPPTFIIKVLNEGEKIGSLAGKLCRGGRKIQVEDWVLAEPLGQSREREKYIIQAKYTKDQVRILKKEGKLKEFVNNDNDQNIGIEISNNDDDDNIDIDDQENIDKMLADL